ncbi:MAG: ABC transporter ATP-binding protein [candidate division Zixibacteria bacterium]|nr:ABC transporter ATP-binding protein [candidate division Zixibacteria bacterium]
MPLIEVEQLSKRFGQHTVLDGISLSIERGESVVIIGQSGTGKSVVLKHLIRLLEPDDGRVIFDGCDLAEIGHAELTDVRRRIAMVFQSAALLDSLTVGENVGLGLKETRRMSSSEIAPIVEECLELVGLADAADKMPSELSGGMRKRVGLARAIANRPEVVLYDEPTTGLDPVTAETINELIVSLNERVNATSVAVTHDMHSAFMIAHRIIMLHRGMIVFDGTPQEIQASGDPIVRQFIEGKAVGPLTTQV